MPRPLLHRALDPGLGFRQARRGGARGRCRRRRLDPSRRDGRPFRARTSRSARTWSRRCARTRKKMFDMHLMIAPCDPLSRSLRQGRLRHHHRACRSRPARAPLAAGDPRARQEGRRDAQSRHAGRDDRERDRSGRSDPGHVGQSRLRRAGIHPGRAREDRAASRAMVGGRPIDIEVDGGITPDNARRGRRAPAPTCWSRAPPCSRAGAAAYRANIAAIRKGRARARRSRLARFKRKASCSSESARRRAGASRYTAAWPLYVFSAASTRSGVNGVCRSRTPVSCDERIGDRRRDQRRRHLSRAGRMVVGLDQLDVHLRHVAHARQRSSRRSSTVRPRRP